MQAGRAYALERLPAIAESRAMAQGMLAQVDGCTVPPANGAFYLLLRLKTSHHPMELAERLIREYRVAVIPGNAFGLDAGCNLRVAYAALPQESIREGCERLVRGLRELLHSGPAGAP